MLHIHMRNNWRLVGVRSDENLRCLYIHVACRTRVWQPLFHFLCDKSLEFAIQNWQTPWEHWVVYRWTYFLSQLCIMLILPIRSHCEICPLPTIQVCWEAWWGGGGGGGGGSWWLICYPPCKKGIQPGICVQRAVSHEAGGLVRCD